MAGTTPTETAETTDTEAEQAETTDTEAEQAETTDTEAEQAETSAEVAAGQDDGRGVDYWKKRARDNEARAKANAEAAKAWEKWQEEHKSNAEKQADATRALEVDRDAARSEARRARAALKHQLTEDQVALLDPSGDDEEFEARAAALAELLSATNKPARFRDPNLGRERINTTAGDWLRHSITGA